MEHVPDVSKVDLNRVVITPATKEMLKYLKFLHDKGVKWLINRKIGLANLPGLFVETPQKPVQQYQPRGS